ncbi:molybdate ABC transporter substrate-binding protein [Altererythrobacter sp. KTW20L]|uniref:molybdate ABC transporter substrate-binding protein n=1 Tax=Altererythrobacter sp. KTW20L TaxID=2942210 RepID=UPI0020BFC289|nr:molybdate ABC transporter substrate-binding protein [Altererythrobacter sp. KTW20L]
MLLSACGTSPDDSARVAAASDLRLALTEVAAAFESETGHEVDLVFGSSGNFFQQLQHDAPFDLFLSADEQYVLDLAEAGKTRDRGRLYAVGRLALVAPTGSPLQLDPQLQGLRQAAASGQIEQFAIANPDHAPYGQRAREALEHVGLWDELEPRLVMGENVSQAMQFAVTGGAQGGIVALSLVNDPALQGKIDHVVIPADWHQPLRQRMVLMRDAGPVAEQFYRYLSGDEARRIFERSGFTLPDGAG